MTEFMTPEQQAAAARLAQAQSPAEYAALAEQAGLTGAAQGLAAAGAAPVSAPSFEEQLAEYQQRNAALQAQINSLTASFSDQLAKVQAGLASVQASVPVKIDPVTESAGKVARAFADIGVSDAKNMLASALRAHFVGLGLEDLAKLV